METLYVLETLQEATNDAIALFGDKKQQELYY